MTTSHQLRGAIASLFLACCILLGGSTRSPLPNMLLQLGAIAILVWAGLASPRAQSGASGRNLVRLSVAMVVLILLQLVPLPPQLWSALPGREPIARGFALLGQPLPWLPLSLAPYDTMTSALWLLPPLAILASVLRLGVHRTSWLAIALGVASFSGVLLGALQVTSGVAGSSPWYLYPITNNGVATGFFANSNHMGTLLVVTIPFIVAMLGGVNTRPLRVQQSASKIAILIGAIATLIIGLALNQSLAAVGLAIPAVAASLLVRAPLSERWARWSVGGVGLLGGAALIAIFASPMSNNLTAVGAGQDYSSRYTSFGNSLRATADMFPAGSGSGSFAAVYPAHENPDIVDRWFVNHVHNDYIELALETGLPGILLMCAFLFWWAGRLFATWRAPIVDHFARAATIASAVILAHSVVDFPLRTTAIAAVFAMSLALMAGPRRRLRIEQVYDQSEGRARHLSLD